MSWMNRVAGLFRSNKLDKELQAELQFHMESRERHFLADGMTPDEARREAKRALGGYDRAMEECRDADRILWIETIWRDLRYSLRLLRASPLFTITAIVSLALGIGANTAVFTLLHAALWKPLPVRDPGQLVHLLRADPSDPSASGGGYSYVLYRQIADIARPFGEIAAKSSYAVRKFGMDVSSMERVAGEAVSPNFFAVAGVDPAAGRFFVPEDGAVAVLSHAFWARRFQTDPAILGKTVYYKETPYTVIGVAQRGFSGMEPEAAIDVWVPIASDVPPRWMTSADVNWLRLIARLRPGVRGSDAQGTLDGFFRATVAREVLPRVPEHFKASVAAQHLLVKPAAAGVTTMGRRYQRPLLLLLGITAVVLLICCANVANLVLARNRARSREIAMRLALGAGRARIATQLLTESLLLAIAGALAGVAVSGPACRLLLRLLPEPSLPLAFDFRPDSTVLGFTGLIAAGTATLFGLFPALGAARTAELKSGSRAARHFPAGRLLISGQLALALMLLVGAGLFLGTLRNYKAIDLGFRPESIVAFNLSFPRGTPPERVRQSYAQIREGLAELPGVVSASYGTGAGWSLGVHIEGRPDVPGEDNEAGVIAAGPEWFETIQVGLLAGRYLNERDGAPDAPPVVVINARLARRFFGDVSPVGRRMVVGRTPVREIVGVIRDARHYGLKEKEWPMVFIPTANDGGFLVRTTQDLTTQTIRGVAAAAGGVAQVERVRAYQEEFDSGLDKERLMAALCSVFAGLATLLAAVGLYGVLAYSVSRRTSELGIRMALGAQRRDVEWLIVRETAGMIAAGTAAGLAGAFAATRLVSAMLFGIRASDPAVYALAALALAAVAGVAGWLPARRASRVDPMIALRYE